MQEQRTWSTRDRTFIPSSDELPKQYLQLTIAGRAALIAETTDTK